VENISRIFSLYQKLYREKYTLNVNYTELFFKDILNDSNFHILALKKEKIDAFAIYEKNGRFMQAPCVGYDITLPRELALYRQIATLLIETARTNNLSFNASSGVAQFKINRGGYLIPEFYAVYSHHLPFYKRVSWKLFVSLLQRTWTIVEEKIIKYSHFTLKE